MHLFDLYSRHNPTESSCEILVIDEARRGRAGYLKLLRASTAPLKSGPYGTSPKIGEASDEELDVIINKIQSLLDPKLKKYEEYYVQQVAKGNILLWKLEEDSERFNRTLALFQKYSRKAAWDMPKDIFAHKDWKKLERQVARYRTEEEVSLGEGQHSNVVYSKTYQIGQPDVLTAIYGERQEPKTRTYHLRQILTPEGASKYGKGTQWCTNTVVPPRILQGAEAESYVDKMTRQWAPFRKGGIWDKIYATIEQYVDGETDWILNPNYYNSVAIGYLKGGLHIVEVEDDKGRRPILQASGMQVMNVNDVPITNIGPIMKDFLQHALPAAHAANKTVQPLPDIAEVSEGMFLKGLDRLVKIN